jgi:ankyrin repeat protein
MVQKMLTALSNPPQNPTMLRILNAQNKSGNTPLHWAALNGHLECVKVLIDGGADPTITNSAGHDAVYEAELNDKQEVVEWVLKESEGMEEGIAGDADEGADEPESSKAAEVGSEEAAEALRGAVGGMDINDKEAEKQI